MEMPALTDLIKTPGETLVALLDYIEQVVRLDERVAFRLADDRLPDGTVLAISAADAEGLPGVVHDGRDESGPIWLTVERLARCDPPAPPSRLAPWIRLEADPGREPAIIEERLVTVTQGERDRLVQNGEVGEADLIVMPVAAAEGEAAPRFDRRLRLDAETGLKAEIEAWIGGPHCDWAAKETLRRRTIALYGKLYKAQQLLELGGHDSAIEVVFGIGTLLWHHEGRVIDRPLIERSVEIELEETGRLRVRPRAADARVDLKPFEDFGCDSLTPLEEIVRREIARTALDEGVSPYQRDTFEPILVAAATRLAANGIYAPGRDRDPKAAGGALAQAASAGPVVSDGWVLFARPRSAHVLIDDIARLRGVAQSGTALAGLAARLITAPSDRPDPAWQPLGPGFGTGEAAVGEPALGAAGAFDEVFFPKPFNDDQLAIVARLARSDGLVVQGPPGTGKTHTIANLICHAMAIGERVLVVSRGEAALSVLRGQLPDKVRPLTISILSSEREGLRQVETAIREIQAVVEDSRPEIRRSAIRRCEAEILKIRQRLASIDSEIDDLAERQIRPLGPANESPADLAKRLGAMRDPPSWFTDRPMAFFDETGLAAADIAALEEARRHVGDLLDHAEAGLPSLEDLPGIDLVKAWHADLCRSQSLAEAAAKGPAHALRVEPANLEQAERGARLLRELAATSEAAARLSWLKPHLRAAIHREAEPFADLLLSLCDAFWEVEAKRAQLAPFGIELPEGLLDDEPARAAVERAALGERPWPRLSIGKTASKARFAAIRLRGRPPGEDRDAWHAVAEQMMAAKARHGLAARWRSFAPEGADTAGTGLAGLETAARLVRLVERLRRLFAEPALVGPAGPPPDLMAEDPGLARALAAQIEWAVSAARLALLREDGRRLAAAFPGQDRTSLMARDFFGDVLGRPDVAAEKAASIYAGLRACIGDVHARAGAFRTVMTIAGKVAAAGAPDFARRLRHEPARAEADPLLDADWRGAWDWAAGRANLARIDGRERFGQLARERDAADRRGRKLFVELVRERAFHALERRLSPRVKSALVEYVRALGRLGKGTGKGAGRHRQAARDAMARCYDAVPCWIMPTWRVAEQLPADLAAFDLVILDEASQSDVTELPALLRGRKVLAVGDDRQVSPTPPFVSRLRIDHLRQHYLRHLPFASLLEPGESLYDLMRAVFPDSRLMLKEHFRCVEPIIRFSMQFYPEKLVPLRIPTAAERFDPPLVDIYVPHGAREGARKINRAEAEVIVAEIAAIAEDPALARRSIGVISLIGAEQAELVRLLLAERIGEAAMQRHAILCGDSATFQGNERDIMFLSMVADRKRRNSLTMLRYEQRFNVAASRARDRLVLVRSVAPDDLSPHDLKARLIAHFADPLAHGGAGRSSKAASPDQTPAADPLEACESDFEREVMSRLIEQGYHVTPQVGAEGFRIDLVVEGADGRRLAIECDGDRYHGPAQWREDIRRQRILERVGWRFWRCFASNFYANRKAVLTDLADALAQAGIRPMPAGMRRGASPLTEHRIAPAPAATSAQARLDFSAPPPPPAGDAGVDIGDRIALLFDDRKRITLRLTDREGDETQGLVSVTTPLGRALRGAEAGDEIDVAQPAGPPTRVLVEAVEKAG